MCTAISFKAESHYFGRNLDYEHDFGEKVVVTPRRYEFSFKNGETLNNHYAIIGMAVVKNNYPLYFDATNEKGLSMAGLNFFGNAVYNNNLIGKTNIASYELIPWILCKCQSVLEVKRLIANLNITNHSFMPELRPTPLHWLISDSKHSVTVEQTNCGLKVFDNPVGVLTNNPTFDFHLSNLSNYMFLTSKEVTNEFSNKVALKAQSRGMGSLGLPGDYTSVSRFVRAAFVKLNSVCTNDEIDEVNQFFHILYSVYQQRGVVKVGKKYEITNYTSCCNTDRGIYYYTTYNNFSVNSVNINSCNLNDAYITEFELVKTGTINKVNS